MQIANPIYDVVFKYLLDDNRIAKLMISKIIGEEIETLEFLPTEKRAEVEKQPTLNSVSESQSFGTEKNIEPEMQTTITVYRLDFSAKIKTREGEYKQVIIEIQKAKFPTDIMRFRKYLGQQYSDEENFEMINDRKVAMPIISIYFIGQKLDKAVAPIIKVSRAYIDLVTGNEIKEKEEFIESLTHDSFIIQIQRLKQSRRNELEILLSIFDQDNIEKDHHILNINEDIFPEEFKIIIRRLQRAIADKQIRNTMDIEDEIVEELANMERSIYNLSETVKDKDRLIESHKKTIAEKDKEIEELKKKMSEKY